MTNKQDKYRCAFNEKEEERCLFSEQLEAFEAMFNAISDAIVLVDVERRIFRVNKGMETVFGYTIDDLAGKTTAVLYDSEEEYLRQGKIRFNLSAEEKKKPYVVNYRRKNGQVFPGETIGTVAKNSAGEVTGYIGVIRDVSERKKAQDEIQRLAMTDQLTGLGNRNQFNQRFDASLKLAAREKNRLALILLDLDKFKSVNDTFGHPAGDTVLQSVAGVFPSSCRETDVVARLGGDEFAILLVDPDGILNIQMVVERIIGKIARPFKILGNNISIGVSVGIAIYPDDATEKESLIRMADLALYKAKGSDLKSFMFFHSDLIPE
ncbi:MAG TPA: sensor domain-containing diguanylate cyclase [Anaerolineales bacterium]|nr:sensor domain-containing diguanylate cyclase [Anaerolineales bacterium]